MRGNKLKIIFERGNMYLSQNVWNWNCNFGSIFRHWNEAEICMCNVFCCPVLGLFSYLPLWKTAKYLLCFVWCLDNIYRQATVYCKVQYMGQDRLLHILQFTLPFWEVQYSHLFNKRWRGCKSCQITKCGGWNKRGGLDFLEKTST